MIDELKNVNCEVLGAIARDYIEKEEYNKAISYLEEMIRLGDFKSNIDLGVVYERKEDYKKALEYYELASKTNNGIATLNLGMMYEYGRGVKIDLEKAISIYKRGLGSGEFAEDNYMHIYNCYLDLKKPEAAMKILLDAANTYPNSCTACLTQLGYCYEEGEGVAKDLVKAIYYYQMAASKDEVKACYNLGNIYYDNTSNFYNLELAIKYFSKASFNGHADATYMLATIYRNEDLAISSPQLVEFLLKKSAKMGSFIGTFVLAEELFKGTYLKENKKMANDLFTVIYETVVGDESQMEVLDNILKINPDFKYEGNYS